MYMYILYIYIYISFGDLSHDKGFQLPTYSQSHVATCVCQKIGYPKITIVLSSIIVIFPIKLARNWAVNLPF